MGESCMRFGERCFEAGCLWLEPGSKVWREAGSVSFTADNSPQRRICPTTFGAGFYQLAYRPASCGCSKAALPETSSAGTLACDGDSGDAVEDGGQCTLRMQETCCNAGASGVWQRQTTCQDGTWAPLTGMQRTCRCPLTIAATNSTGNSTAAGGLRGSEPEAPESPPLSPYLQNQATASATSAIIGVVIGCLALILLACGAWRLWRGPTRPRFSSAELSSLKASSPGTNSPKKTGLPDMSHWQLDGTPTSPKSNTQAAPRRPAMETLEVRTPTKTSDMPTPSPRSDASGGRAVSACSPLSESASTSSQRRLKPDPPPLPPGMERSPDSLASLVAAVDAVNTPSVQKRDAPRVGKAKQKSFPISPAEQGIVDVKLEFKEDAPTRGKEEETDARASLDPPKDEDASMAIMEERLPLKAQTEERLPSKATSSQMEPRVLSRQEPEREPTTEKEKNNERPGRGPAVSLDDL